VIASIAAALLFSVLAVPEPFPADCAPRAAHALHVGGDVTAPVVVKSGNIAAALTKNHAPCLGLLSFEVTITPEGNVGCVRVLQLGKGVTITPELAASLREAVRSYKFKPATRKGKPVEVLFNLTYHFKCQ